MTKLLLVSNYFLIGLTSSSVRCNRANYGLTFRELTFLCVQSHPIWAPNFNIFNYLPPALQCSSRLSFGNHPLYRMLIEIPEEDQDWHAWREELHRDHPFNVFIKMLEGGVYAWCYIIFCKNMHLDYLSV